MTIIQSSSHRNPSTVVDRFEQEICPLENDKQTACSINQKLRILLDALPNSPRHFQTLPDYEHLH